MAGDDINGRYKVAASFDLALQLNKHAVATGSMILFMLRY
jgi:hypothetical protein